MSLQARAASGSIFGVAAGLLTSAVCSLAPRLVEEFEVGVPGIRLSKYVLSAPLSISQMSRGITPRTVCSLLRRGTLFTGAKCEAPASSLRTAITPGWQRVSERRRWSPGGVVRAHTPAAVRNACNVLVAIGNVSAPFDTAEVEAPLRRHEGGTVRPPLNRRELLRETPRLGRTRSPRGVPEARGRSTKRRRAGFMGDAAGPPQDLDDPPRTPGRRRP